MSELENDSFWWELEGDTARLHDAFKNPQRYDKPSLEFAVDCVKKQRGSYATRSAYDRQLRKFELGLALLNGKA